MSFSDINAALSQNIADCLSSLNIPAFWQNQNRTEIKDLDVFAEVFIEPAVCDMVTMGLCGEDEERGFAQITLRYKSDTGIGQAVKHFDAIYKSLRIKPINFSGQQVRIDGIQRKNGGLQDGWFSLYVTIYYSSRILRAS